MMYTAKGMPIHFMIAKMTDLPEDFTYEVDCHRIDQIEVGVQIRTRNRAEGKIKR